MQFSTTWMTCVTCWNGIFVGQRVKASRSLFPESFLLGHSYDPLVIAARADRLADGGLEMICSRLAWVDTTVIVGAFERRGDVIVKSAFVIEHGRVIGRYAKTYPNEPSVVAGTDYPVFRRSGFCYGINICNDANQPTAAQRLTDHGTSLILYPLNNMRPRRPPLNGADEAMIPFELVRGRPDVGLPRLTWQGVMVD